MHVLVHKEDRTIQGYGTMEPQSDPDHEVVEIDDAERAKFRHPGSKRLDVDGIVQVLPLTEEERAALDLRPGPIMTPERLRAEALVREKAKDDPAFAALLTIMGIGIEEK